MGAFIDLTGQRFERWVVIKRAENNKYNQTQWLCQCDCGNIKATGSVELRSRDSQSCGCLKKEKAAVVHLVHGHAKKRGLLTKTYSVWAGIKQRCNNPNNKGYKNYGGRGIKICKRWDKFENFLADMGEVPKGLMIDRKDNNGNYEPENCRWITRKIQNRNRRDIKLTPLKVQVIKKLHKESNLTGKDIAEIFNVSIHTIYAINTGNSWNDIIYKAKGV